MNNMNEDKKIAGTITVENKNLTGFNIVCLVIMSIYLCFIIFNYNEIYNIQKVKLCIEAAGKKYILREQCQELIDRIFK